MSKTAKGNRLQWGFFSVKRLYLLPALMGVAGWSGSEEVSFSWVRIYLLEVEAAFFDCGCLYP